MIQSCIGERMKVLPSNLRLGNVIKEKNKLWSVVRMQHTQPGKGGAYFQIELRNIEDQTKQIKRVRSSEELEKAVLLERKASYLFRDASGHIFMDCETYDQISVQDDIVGGAHVFLQEGLVVTLTMYEGRVIGVTFPKSVEVVVESADAVVKGQTATSSYKSAVLVNGVTVKVPPHIEGGTAIMIDPNTGEYLAKA